MSKPDSKQPNYAPKAMTSWGVSVMSGFILLESAVVVMIATGKTAEGFPPYNTSSIVLVVEFGKLLASIFGLWQAGKASGLVTHGQTTTITGEEGGLLELKRITPSSFIRYSIPSLLYAVNNNIFLFILTRMPPAYFQLLLNSRVVWTGLAFRWFMGRHLTKRQWFASFVLLFGCVLSQYSGGTTGEVAIAVSMSGLALTLLYCAISVSASVYNELLMKNEPSLHLANIQLYTCGVVFNLVALIVQGSSSDHSGSSGGGFWRGWDIPRTWIICCFQIVIGLLISRVMKHFDSIMKIFCVACSNLVVYGVSVANGSQPFTIQFMLAFVIVTFAGYRYSTPGPSEEK